MFRDEVAVLTEPIARSFDLNDRSMVEKPVQQRGGDDGRRFRPIRQIRGSR